MEDGKLAQIASDSIWSMLYIREFRAQTGYVQNKALFELILQLYVAKQTVTSGKRCRKSAVTKAEEEKKEKLKTLNEKCFHVWRRTQGPVSFPEDEIMPDASQHEHEMYGKYYDNKTTEVRKKAMQVLNALRSSYANCCSKARKALGKIIYISHAYIYFDNELTVWQCRYWAR